jgi:hypothetical protein
MKRKMPILPVLFLTLFVGSTAFSDGKKVACGGEYGSYAHSIDGSDVACGGEYGSYAHSIDGTSVCAGGRYGSYVHSIR